MSDRTQFTEPMPWQRQEGESDKAFEAFRIYLEMGPKRSIARVAQECTKSGSLIKRWSKRWSWQGRVRKHTDSLTAKTDSLVQHQAETKAIMLMGVTEVIGRTSMLARASAVDLLNEKGDLDIADIRRRGLGYLVSAIRTRTTTTRNGATTVTQEVKVENRKGFLELLGKHHGLWTDEFEDPREVLARILGRPKGWLPPKLDEPDAIEAEAVEVPNKSEERSLTLAGKSKELPADVALDAKGEHDLEQRTESELPQHHEPTPREFNVSNPLTPSKVELDEKAPVKNILQGYRKLNGAKSVTWKDNSVEAAQNYAPVSGSRTLL
jgi:hypothetical protein